MFNQNNNSFLGSTPPITRNLLIINVVVWLILRFFDRGFLFSILSLRSIDAGHFFVYQLVTSMFVHLEFWHLFFNMFALFIFGRTMEQYWGSKRFLFYYMLTGIGAGFLQWIICNMQNEPAICYGASGAVFGLLLAFGMTFPNAPVYLYFLLPIKAKWLVIGFGVIELVSGMSSRGGGETVGVGHFAHLGGMLFGLLLILYWRNKYAVHRFFDVKKWFKKKPKITYYKHPETDYDYNKRKKEEQDYIDSILDKIKKSGYNSLTENEKKALFNAGKQ